VRDSIIDEDFICETSYLGLGTGFVCNVSDFEESNWVQKKGPFRE